ncbi:hypothetical protein ACE1ET_20405 [Saccharicrinis sp. FJH62]|uniref:hypothetical protein n=1 Tax=Saccharicrinis sp. FJH62 TaxID=3344657 RepID=UPI0035D5184D
MYNKLLINKEIFIDETLDNVTEKLTKLSERDNHLDKISDWRYFFMPNESIGTFSNYYGITSGIRIYVNLDFEDDTKTRINFKSKPRLELIIFLASWIGLLISQISGKVDMPNWVHISNAILFIFGWFFYRRQEISLLKISEQKLINALQHAVIRHGGF